MTKKKLDWSRETPFSRFEKMYFPEPNSGCWLWMHSYEPFGYGRFSINGVQIKAHRFAYMHYRGEIPKGLVLDHICRVPECCNPWHLEAVTQHENMLRSATSRKTHCRNGHELTGDNLLIVPRKDKHGKSFTHRRCAMCRRVTMQKARAKWRQHRRQAATHQGHQAAALRPSSD